MTYRTPIVWMMSLLLAGLIGCASTPTDSNTPRAADLPPIPYNYRDLIRDHLTYSVLGEFAEGYRADIDIREPYPAAFRRQGQSEWFYGHAVPVRATTPVRYGGYVANMRYRYFFADGAMRSVGDYDTLRRLR